MFESERKRDFPIPQGHEARFEARLGEAFPKKKTRPFFWLGIAASTVALLGLAFWMFRQDPLLPEGEGTLVEQQTDTIASPSSFSLGDLSPDLKKLEQYYTASINLELAGLVDGTDVRPEAIRYLQSCGIVGAGVYALARRHPKQSSVQVDIVEVQLVLSVNPGNIVKYAE